MIQRRGLLPKSIREQIQKEFMMTFTGDTSSHVSVISKKGLYEACKNLYIEMTEKLDKEKLNYKKLRAAFVFEKSDSEFLN